MTSSVGLGPQPARGLLLPKDPTLLAPPYALGAFSLHAIESLVLKFLGVLRICWSLVAKSRRQCSEKRWKSCPDSRPIEPECCGTPYQQARACLLQVASAHSPPAVEARR